ncbi:MAG: lactonase family protein [Lawsonibacter sp.]|jgi:6-phosphogluconolactonase|uniref:lactonase family protein n=1 Tax=Lawsonibacter sp. JLR.KK007 TaxID=3114293 RepID=UPI0021711A31|nr:lactonase family protein [Lawsonibacter sp.]
MKFAYTASYTTNTTEYNRYAQGEGLHVYCISDDGAQWTEVQAVPENNPAFITFGKNKQVLYAAQSASPVPLTGIVAYAVDRKTGRLTKLPRQLDLQRAICCFSVHPAGRYLVAADFKGNIFSISLRDDGSLERVVDSTSLEGPLGPLTKVQACSRPHHIPFDMDGNYLVIPDKGYDLVHVYHLDPSSGALKRISQTPVRPASCPRHAAFHPNRKMVYMLAEYTSKIYVFRYENGHLTTCQVLSAEQSTYCGLYCKSSEIAVHPNGKFLYVSNRGDDTIGIFRIDSAGLLTPVAWQKTHGEIPRFFTLDEAGRKMYVGNQKTGTVTVFTADSDTGLLTWDQRPIPVPCPTWILFSD